uniref:Uncharacterized protein n=1 Tax=Pogona vitticeps TaxID=103695 RepID=A0ABM5G971_9SAUR
MTYEVEGNSSPRDLLDSEGTLHNISSICDEDSTRTPTSDMIFSLSASERRKNVTYDVEETSSPWVYQDQQDTLDDVSSIKDEEWFPSPNSARIFSLGASEQRKNVTYDVEENLDSRDQQNTLDDVSSIKDEEWFPSPNSARIFSLTASEPRKNVTYDVVENSNPLDSRDQQNTLDDVSSIKDEEWFPSPNSARIFSLTASEPRKNVTYDVVENSNPLDSRDQQDTLDDVSSIKDEEWFPSPNSARIFSLTASEPRKNVTYDVVENSNPLVYQDQQDTLDDVSSIKDEEWFPSPKSARIFSLTASEPGKNVTYDVVENSNPLDSRDQQDTLDDVSSIKDEEWFPSPNSASVLQTQRNQTFTVEESFSVWYSSEEQGTRDDLGSVQKEAHVPSPHPTRVPEQREGAFTADESPSPSDSLEDIIKSLEKMEREPMFSSERVSERQEKSFTLEEALSPWDSLEDIIKSLEKMETEPMFSAERVSERQEDSFSLEEALLPLDSFEDLIRSLEREEW